MSAPSSVAPKLFWGLTLAGAAGAAATFALSGAQRFWMNWLWLFLLFATVGLGCLFIVALERVVGAFWSVPVRRVPERLSTVLFAAIPLALVGLFSLKALYPWTDPALVAKSHFLSGKAAWLNIPFFSGRVALSCLLWGLFWWLLVRGSVKQDATGDPAFSLRARKYSGAFVAAFAVTVTLVAFDWVSSLEPEWYSDIFGVYLFAGTFLAGLAATSLGVTYLMERGRLPGVTSDHLYNLGGLLFAFTVFWSYIGFAQYMLMWYANMPEEIVWYQARIDGPWRPVILLLALLHFAIPFFILVARGQKSNATTLRRVALLILAAHALDLYWLLFPSLRKGVLFGWQELSFLALFVGVGMLIARRTMTYGKDMPSGDPLLPKGLEFRL